MQGHWNELPTDIQGKVVSMIPSDRSFKLVSKQFFDRLFKPNLINLLAYLKNGIVDVAITDDPDNQDEKILLLTICENIIDKKETDKILSPLQKACNEIFTFPKGYVPAASDLLVCLFFKKLEINLNDRKFLSPMHFDETQSTSFQLLSKEMLPLLSGRTGNYKNRSEYKSAAYKIKSSELINALTYIKSLNIASSESNISLNANIAIETVKNTAQQVSNGIITAAENITENVRNVFSRM